MKPLTPTGAVAVATVCCLAGATASAQAGEGARKRFDVPRGDAVGTLKRFAEDSGQQVVYLVDAVRGITTNAVRGEYTVREALTRLVANTGLVVAEDAKSGAVMVNRLTSREPPPSPPEPKPKPKPKTNAMATKPRNYLPLLAGWLLGAGSAASQTALSAPPREEAVVLSPFTVSTTRDNGFVAASSLAGGRLATDLRDTPVAFSVVTREFIDALGLTDLGSVAEWTTSTVPVPAADAGLFNNTPDAYSVRGSSTGRPQRNYFPYFSIGDTYNLERVDFGRGPNSILFGNGSMGGISSSTTKRAQTNRAFQTLQTGYGNWQNYRATLDVNRPLSEKAAVRINGVWGDGKGWHLKEFDQRKAMSANFTVRPWRDTEIRVDGEWGRIARQAGGTTIQEQFAGWDGKTVFSGPATTLPANANALGVSRRAANYYIYDPSNPTKSIVNYQNDPATLGGGQTNTTPVAGFVQGSLPAFGQSFSGVFVANNVPAGRFDTAIANSFFRPISESFSVTPDFPLLSQTFRDLQISITQRFGNFYLELAADKNINRATINTEQGRGLNTAYIDINKVRPDGSPNSNFLQPYGDAQIARNFRDYAYQNLRAAAAYVFNSKPAKITVNTMAGSNRNRDLLTSRYLSLAQGDDHRQWGFLSAPAAQSVRVRRYWNAEKPMPDLAGRQVTFVDPITATTKTITPIWAVDTSRRDNEQDNTNNFKYLLASINAKLFQDRLVLLGAARRDTYFFRSVQQSDKGDYPLDWNGTNTLYRPAAPADYYQLIFRQRDASGNPTGPEQEAAIRPRDANGNRNPLYSADRFKDDFNSPPVEGSMVTRSVGGVYHFNRFINPSFNFAETFNPPIGLVRIDGSLLKPTVATGRDFGWRMELLENRLQLNFTYFRSKEINGIVSGDGPTFFNTLYNANPVGDLSTVGRNIRGAGALPVQYRDTRTRTGDGYEMEIVANLTRGLRLTGSVGFPRVYESSLNPDVKAYIDKNLGLFKQIANDAGVLVDANNVATVDNAVPINQRSPDASNAATAFNNIIAFRKNIIDGKRLAQDQPTANFFADYTIQSDRLKGLRFGAGARYRGHAIIGYRGADTIVSPSNPTVAVDDPAVDAYTPIYTKGYTVVTTTLAYTWRLPQGRSVQANLAVNNVLNDRGPIWITNSTVLRPKNNDYTSPARETTPLTYSLKKPISYNLTLTWKL